jgi:predicted DNA binding protein
MGVLPTFFGWFKYFYDNHSHTGDQISETKTMTAPHPRNALDPQLNKDQVEPTSRNTTMRYATIVLDPGPEGFYPVCAACIEQAKITSERIHHINLLDDGTIVGLYQFRGDLERVRAELDDSPRVLSYDIAGTDDVHLYLHEEATDLATTLLSALDEFEIILDTPQEFMTDGTLRVTLVGTGAALQQALTAIATVIEVHLEETGEYRPEMRDLVSRLTDRQHQILRIAVEKGYYEAPRRATYQDIAAEVGLSHATVAEHIQKIEATMLSQAVL